MSQIEGFSEIRRGGVVEVFDKPSRGFINGAAWSKIKCVDKEFDE